VSNLEETTNQQTNSMKIAIQRDIANINNAVTAIELKYLPVQLFLP
jgi:hypothetical protein